MRDENFVSIFDLLGRPNSPVRFLSEWASAASDEWIDRRSGLSQPVAHGATRLFQIDEAIVDLAYGAVFLPSGELIEETTVWDPLRFLMNNPQPPTKASAEFMQGYTVVPASSFYHFLVEDLPRVAWVLKYFPDRQLVAGPDVGRYGCDSSALLKVQLHQTRASHLFVRNYPFVTYESPSGWPRRDTMDFLRSFSLGEEPDRRSKDDGRKLYVSRLTDSRSPSNEDEVIRLAQTHGFDCVDASQLALTEQIDLFSQASSIMGVHGAGLSNSLWMPRGGSVIEIMDPYYYNPCYQWLSQLLGNCHRTVVNSHSHPNMVDLNSLASVLQRRSHS